MLKANKLLDIIYDYEDIYEMANIPSRLHKFGVEVKLQVLQPGNKKIKHGVRVKILKDGEKDFSVILDINPDKIRIVPKHKSFLKGKELRELIKNIKKYRIPLLMLWYDTRMDILELRDLMNKIDKNKEFEINIPGYKGTNKNYTRIK